MTTPPAATGAAIPPGQAADFGGPVGHGEAKRWFANSLAKGCLSGSFLLVGPPGIGRAALAKWIAKCLLCDESGERSLSCCGRCPSCFQVEAETHPDLVQVRKPEDRAFIPVELLIGPAENRMREGFNRDIRLRPFHGTRKVAILHDADYLNDEGANSLLKTLEEPPPDSLIFLLGTNEQRQLPTIRSRCRIVRLHPPRGEQAVELMRRRGIDCDAATAERAIELCGGDCQAAAEVLTADGAKLRQAITQRLVNPPISPVDLAQVVTSVIEDLGKAASAAVKRDRLRDILSIAIDTFRQQLIDSADRPEQLAPIIYRLDRSIEAIAQVQRNANQTTLIECWAADLARGNPA
jgi:DNA polymerase-3 subunit delta'